MKDIVNKIKITIIPMLLIITIDQISKYYARMLLSPISILNFKFNYILNNGLMLGHFSNLPSQIKEVILTTVGAFIFCAYFLCIWLIPIRSRATYLGISIIAGGIIGNIIDRFINLSVVDFISLNIGTHNSPYFNLADIAQWAGYILLFVGVRRDSIYYWPKNDWRNKYLINPKFQIKSSLLIAFFVFFAGGISLIYSYSFLKYGQSQLALEYFYPIGFLVITALSAVTFAISLVLTHRVAGPIHATIRHIKDSLNGKQVQFQLRTNDEFKELEQELNLLNKELIQLKEKEQLSRISEELPDFKKAA